MTAVIKNPGLALKAGNPALKTQMLLSLLKKEGKKEKKKQEN